jgi:flagellar biosynthesis chaperone FliJ
MSNIDSFARSVSKCCPSSCHWTLNLEPTSLFPTPTMASSFNDEHIHEPFDDQHTFDRNRPHSIDLTLELEHQLNSESLPSSPAPQGRPQSLDPHVLASIVMQLRQSLAAATRERDELMDAMENSTSSETELREALQHMTERCTKLQDELEEAKSKIKDDEDAIVMLRSKVEESRRGLMRLQTENRRMATSPLPLDMSRAGVPFAGSASNKRASFTPLTGSRLSQAPGGHRRISSVSDSGLAVPDFGSRDYPSSPGSQSFVFSENPPMTPNHPPVTSRRFSGMFRGSPPLELSPPQDPMAEQIEALRRELKSVRNELEETRHELTEANEAREASETCVTALRAFIDANNVGVQAASTLAKPPPPPPAMSRDDTSSVKSSSGWGFKLWKADPPSKPASVAPVSTAPPPLSKLGGFFSSRASVSSTSSSIQAQPLYHQQEPMCNGSDTSSIIESIAEPVSPTNETQDARVLVRGSGSSSDLSESPQGMKTFHSHTEGRVLSDTAAVAL